MGGAWTRAATSAFGVGGVNSSSSNACLAFSLCLSFFAAFDDGTEDGATPSFADGASVAGSLGAEPLDAVLGSDSVGLVVSATADVGVAVVLGRRQPS